MYPTGFGVVSRFSRLAGVGIFIMRKNTKKARTMNIGLYSPPPTNHVRVPRRLDLLLRFDTGSLLMASDIDVCFLPVILSIVRIS